jgi:hypothetical protein
VFTDPATALSASFGGDEGDYWTESERKEDKAHPRICLSPAVQDFESSASDIAAGEQNTFLGHIASSLGLGLAIGHSHVRPIFKDGTSLGHM